MASLPPTFDGAAAAQRIRDVNTATWQLIGAQGKPIHGILSPVQIQLLWQPVIATIIKGYNDSTWATGDSNWW